jgi:hypothetical protein
MQGGPTRDEAMDAFEEGSHIYIDYFKGVAIKCDFKNFPNLDLSLYFRDCSADFEFSRGSDSL